MGRRIIVAWLVTLMLVASGLPAGSRSRTKFQRIRAAVKTFLVAAQKGDVVHLKKLTTGPFRQSLESLGPEGLAYIKAIGSMIKAVDSVFVRGNRADVSVSTDPAKVTAVAKALIESELAGVTDPAKRRLLLRRLEADLPRMVKRMARIKVIMALQAGKWLVTDITQ